MKWRSLIMYLQSLSEAMDKRDEYNDVKKEIRSLLITFKNGCSFSEFRKQYQLMIGPELPFSKFQFKDEIELLQSMPDAVQISPKGRNYYLKVVTDQTTKHVQKLVKKQKSNKQKPASRPSYPLPSRFTASKSRIKKELSPSLIQEVVNLIRNYQGGLKLQNVVGRYQSCYGKELHYLRDGIFTLEEFLRSIPQLNFRRIDNDIYVLCSSQGEDDYPRFPETNIIKIKSGTRQSTSNENNGHFKRKLDSLDEFNFSLDKSGDTFSSSEKIRNDLAELLPAKALHPLNQYTEQRLPTRLIMSSFFPAYVANIINPGHMYIQLGDEEQALSDMNHALEKFYTDSESQTLVMNDNHILPGSIGVALWPSDEHWYRIRIMSLSSDDSVKVFFVDYGTIDIISKTLLRYIREDFFDFPAQAMKASLAYVKPPKGHHTWNQRTRNRVLELTSDESVNVKVVDIVDDVLSVILYNKNNVYINGVLLDEYLAQPTSSDGHCPDPMDHPGMASSAIKNYESELPPSIFSPSTEAVQTLSSTSQAFQIVCEEPSAAVNFSKPCDTALTTDTAPITCSKSQIAECGPFLHEISCQPNETVSDFRSLSPSSFNNEVFGEDDDAIFKEFCEKVSFITKRYVKRIRTSDGYVFHILIHESEPYVSGGDISRLIWADKDADCLLQRMQNSGSFLVNEWIWETNNEDMFDQLKKFYVRGLKVHEGRTCLLIFSLNNLIKVLNFFGHPSIELRKKILHELSTFNLNDLMWKELSEAEFPDREEILDARKDDDMLNRLCLYDLKVMRQNIHIRRQKWHLQQSQNPESGSAEVQKLQLLHEKIMQRMKEINEICSTFSGS